MNSNFLWGALTVIFLIIEVAVPGLVSIWFALGSFLALGYSYFIGGLYGEIIVFIVTSIASLFLIKKYGNLQGKKSEKYFGRVIGQISTIKGIDANGDYVLHVDSKEWAGKSTEILQIGDRVKVVNIEGVKLVLEKIENK